MIHTIPRYYYTLKPLKVRQWWYRLIRKSLPLRLYKFPQEIPVVRPMQGTWIWSRMVSSSVLTEEPLILRLLNQEGPGDGEGMDKLWLYNAHYHAVVCSDATPSLKHQVLVQWVEQNPWGEGVGWEPYPLSLRIVNWIKYFMEGTGDSFHSSLYLQCCALEKQIEHHLLGNHLFENAKALVFAGLYFDTKRSKRWLKRGLFLLQQQLDEQILKDGGHFERSPMYHGIILEGLLDLYQMTCLVPEAPVAALEQKIRSLIPPMLSWLLALCHPDGKIAFFNDTTLGVAPDPQDLFQYATSLGFFNPSKLRPLLVLKDSGFVRAQNAEIVVLADVGSVGPSYLPGHAHAETLSFEVSLGSERLFVNSGISTYERGMERAHQRSSPAHNTLIVNGANSSDVWASFRVGRRAKVSDLSTSQDGEILIFSATHDGYRSHGAMHAREWRLSAHELVIVDTVQGTGVPDITLFFHLHPHWQVISCEGPIVSLASPTCAYKPTLRLPEGIEMTIDTYKYAMVFNHKAEGLCLKMRAHKKALPTSFETTLRWL